MPELGYRGRAAYVEEQSSPGGCHRLEEPYCLWRPGKSRSQLAGIPQDRRGAEESGRRGNTLCSVRQGRLCSSDPQGSSQGDHRQFQYSALLGHAGELRQIRRDGSDDVWPDDGGFVGLHRYAGDTAGHLRNLRRPGSEGIWHGFSEREDRAHSRDGWNVGCTAAGCCHERGGNPGR